MKVSLLFIFALLMLSACRKNNGTCKPGIENAWDLKLYQVSIMPARADTPGVTHTLVFSGLTYQELRNGKLEKSGSYKILEDTVALPAECLDLPPGQHVTRLVFDNDRINSKRIEKLTCDTLILSSGCTVWDGATFLLYLRQKGKSN